MDTRGIKGLDIACAGTCPNCKAVTWGILGTPEAREFVGEFLREETGKSVDEVMQLAKLKQPR